MDLQGDHVFVNSAAAKMLGYTPKELVGKSSHNTWHYKHVDGSPFPVSACPIHSTLQDGKSHVGEEYLFRKDGTCFLSEFSSRPTFLNSEVTGAVISFRDITERKKAEEALQKNQVLLNETGRIAKVGGWEFDVETQEQVWTEEVYRIHEVDMAYKPTVSKGIDFYAPTSRPIIEQAVQRAIEYGEPFEVELEFITAKGNPRWVRAIGKAHQEHGITKKVFGVFQDVTERRQAEKALDEERRRLQKALDEVRTLRGILPICTNCKKIRDDQGYWNQVEVYVRDHTEAEFSHGLCPECMKKLHHEFEQDDDGSAPQSTGGPQ